MKKTSTKLLAIIMTLALLTGAIGFMTFATETTNPLGYSASRVVKKDLTGIVNINSYLDDPTKTEYVVTDLNGLLSLAAIVSAGDTMEGVTIYQGANISGKGLGENGANATFTGIGVGQGKSVKVFAGTYDGQGYVVDHLVMPAKVPTGFFADLAGVVRNVVLGDSITVSGSNKAGILVGEVRAKDGTPVVIDNCYVSGTINTTGSLCGGVVGQADWNPDQGDGTKLVMKNITFNGSVTIAKGRAGGLLGRAADIDLEIDNCVVAGTLISGSATEPAAITEIKEQGAGSQDIKKVSSMGGFVGETTRAADKILIKNSVNLANITSGYAAAAFLGSLPAKAGATIQGCTNYGTITSSVPSGTSIKVADKDADGNAIEVSIMMRYHSALAGYIYNTDSVLNIGDDSKNLAGQTAPAFEKIDFTKIDYTAPGGDENESTTPEVTTPEVTTPEETTPEVTTPEVTTPEATTPADTTAKAPEQTTGADTEEKKGCGAVVGGSIVAIVAIAGGAMFFVRKKED